MAQNFRGMTLIEILVACALISLLMTIAMPVLGSARRQSMATAAKALLQRVEGAIGTFRSDCGVLPYAADASGNRLVEVLATSATSAMHDALRTDLAAARAAYAGGSHTFTDADVDPRETSARAMHAGCLNRLAAERASNAVLAGNTGVLGLGSRKAQPVLDHPASSGWCDDYLGGELPAANRQGSAIVDPYGAPLIYVCPVVAGVRGYWPATGLAYTVKAKQASVALDAEYYGLQTSGRAATVSRSSDIADSAAEAYRFDCELWSAGPDRSFAPRRDDPANRDNLAIRPYLQDLR